VELRQKTETQHTALVAEGGSTYVVCENFYLSTVILV